MPNSGHHRSPRWWLRWLWLRWWRLAAGLAVVFMLAALHTGAADTPVNTAAAASPVVDVAAIAAPAQPPPPSPPASPAPAQPGSGCAVPPGQPRPPQCIPQPSAPPGTPGAPAAPAAPGGQPQVPSGVGGWITSAISAAIEWFFRQIITSALNPLVELLGRTLLTTPTPDQLPRLAELWEGSRLIAVSAYVLLVMLAGLVLMGHETVQTRHSVKEIAPRLVVGFLALNLSLWVAGVAAGLSNSLAQAVLGNGVDPDTGVAALRELVTNATQSGGGLWLLFVGLALAVMIVVLLVTYVIRIAGYAVLIAAAPLALACHALPQTEGIAYWWWRAFGAILAIQLAQSLTLTVALRVFFTPGGFNMLSGDGWVNLFLALGMVIILIKIPGWLLGAVRVSRGRSLAATVVRAYLAYKTFGLLTGRTKLPGRTPPKPTGGTGGNVPRRRGGGGPGPRGGGSGGGGPRGGGGGGGPRGGGGGRRPPSSPARPRPRTPQPEPEPTTTTPGEHTRPAQPVPARVGGGGPAVIRTSRYPHLPNRGDPPTPRPSTSGTAGPGRVPSTRPRPITPTFPHYRNPPSRR